MSSSLQNLRVLMGHVEGPPLVNRLTRVFLGQS